MVLKISAVKDAQQSIKPVLQISSPPLAKAVWSSKLESLMTVGGYQLLLSMSPSDAFCKALDEVLTADAAQVGAVQAQIEMVLDSCSGLLENSGTISKPVMAQFIKFRVAIMCYVENTQSNEVRDEYMAMKLDLMNTAVNPRGDAKIWTTTLMRCGSVATLAEKLGKWIKNGNTGDPPIKQDKAAWLDYSAADWCQLDTIAKCIIGNSLDQSLYALIRRFEHAHEMVEFINNKFNSSSHAWIAQLQEQFSKVVMKASESVDSYYDRLLTIADSLEELKCPVASMKFQFLNGLTKDYDMAVASIHTAQCNGVNMEIDAIVRNIKLAETVVSKRKTTGDVFLAINNNNNNRSKNRTRRSNNDRPKQDRIYKYKDSGGCWSCGKTGHAKEDCKTCYKCQKWGHYANKCTNDSDKKASRTSGKIEEEIVLMCGIDDDMPDLVDSDSDDDMHGLVNESVDEDEVTTNPVLMGVRVENVNINHYTKKWILDSGASVHVTSDHKDIAQDGKTISIVGVGGQITTAKTGALHGLDGKACMLKSNVGHNILSVPELVNNDWKFSFSKHGCSGAHPGGQIISGVLGPNGLFEVELSEDTSVVLLATTEGNIDKKMTKLHQALGHIGFDKLKRTLPPLMTVGWNRDQWKECAACLTANLKRAPASRKPAAHLNKRHYGPGEYLCCDLIGPMPDGIGGYKYILNIVDFDTRMGFAKPIKDKSATTVGEALLNTIAMLKNQYGILVKVVHSDRGPEFFGYLKSQLQALGIKSSYGAPDSSVVHNGICERRNAALIQGIRVALVESGAPQKCWSVLLDAVEDRILKSKNSNTNYIPYERFHKLELKSTDFERLLTLGSKAYYHNEGTGKLTDRSRLGYFMGQCNESVSGVLKIYNETTDEVIRSRSVKVMNGEFFKADKYKIGDYVEVYFTDGCWYPGKITSTKEEIIDDELVVSNQVLFDDGDEQWQELIPHEIRMATLNNVLAATTIMEPTSIREAMACPNAEQWRLACADEIQTLIDMGTFEPVLKREFDTKPRAMKTKLVFKLKTDSNGDFVKYKARLTACGYSQRGEGIDYNLTSAPVLNKDEMRLLFILAVEMDLKILQYDFVSAFLTAPCTDFDLFVNVPDGLDWMKVKNLGKLADSNVVAWKLKKQLYGTKQAAHEFYKLAKSALLEIGFKPLASAPCIFLCIDPYGVIGLYVDDFMMLGKEKDLPALRSKVKLMELKNKDIKLKYLGIPSTFLGCKISFHKEGGVKVNQAINVNGLIELLELQECKTRSTPMEAIGVDPTSDPRPFATTMFRSVIGSLLYLQQCTRPDISVAVSMLGQFNENPTVGCFNAAKSVVRYLKGTKDLGLAYNKSNNLKCIIEVYTDADYAGDTSDRRSRTGLAVFMNRNLLDWSSTKQKSTATSTCEAEYMAIGLGAKRVMWLTQTLKLLGIEYETPILYTDNQAAKFLSENNACNSKTKHIQIQWHFVREMIADDLLVVKYVSTKEMIADVFTKCLSKSSFEMCRNQLMG